MDFSDFIRACTFPQCVCVTHGYFVSDKVQISCGDVLILKSCNVEHVTMCVPSSNDTIVNVNVTLDSSVKFKVLSPAHDDTSENTITYPTIADLLLDCPTHFEATTSYDDPYLPGMYVNAGDRFWFVRIFKDLKNMQEWLQVRDIKDNIAILSQNCKGHFRPLNDENEYTIKELLDMAPVQRRLAVVKRDVIRDTDSIYNHSQESDISSKVNEIMPQICNEKEVTTWLESPIANEHLPFPPGGIIYMNKPELTVIVSPYNDLETTWQVPVNANLQVRTYSQSDYEVPVSKHQQQSCIISKLPYNELPVFVAPSAPNLPQPQIPIDIHNFVDIYGSSFPVIAKVVNTAKVDPFLQQILRGIDEIIICRLDMIKRLYVKDTKSDTIFALSKDVRLSFVEYPQQFKMVSELAHLHVGSEVIVLEDIAADFPKPLSLRFGDVIRVTSNIPCVIKTKLAGGDCQILKFDRIDSEAGGNTKLILPLDFEVTMMLKTEQNSSKLISIHDLLDGVVPIPSQSVACVSEDVSNEAINELPSNLQILKRFKETCIVAKATPTFLTQFPSVYPPKDKSSLHCSSGSSTILPNIGIPLTSRLVLTYRDCYNLPESLKADSVVDFIAPPFEKMTIAQFEERQRHLQEHTDYEDVESGSRSTVDEYRSTSDVTTRTNSQGILEKIQKSAKMDTVRRFSQALNPKYWRQTKSRPLPLPHPFAMGPTYFTINQNKTTEMGFTSAFGESADDESTNLELITRYEAEDENLYEELEINPCKPTMPAAQVCPNSEFSELEYTPLPPPNTPPKLLPRCAEKQTAAVASDSVALCLSEASDIVQSAAKIFNEHCNRYNKKHPSEIYKPLMRVKTWANNFGNSMGNRFSTRLKNDTPKSNIVDHVYGGVDYDITQPEKIRVDDMCLDDKRCDSSLPLTRSKSQNELWELKDKRKCANNMFPPFKLQPNGEGVYISTRDFIENQTGKEEQERTDKAFVDLKHSDSSKTLEPQTPKPKPRTLNKSLLLARDQCYPAWQHIINEQLSLNATDCVEHVKTLPDDAKYSPSRSPRVSLPQTVENNCPPKPLPKPRNRTSTKV